MCDVYIFGIVLLRLLTARTGRLVDTVKLTSLLDPLAGDWPFVLAEQLAFVLAEQLAHLALRCL
jgi:hypothetical protein